MKQVETREDEEESDEVIKQARIISEWSGIDFASIEKMLKVQGSMESDFALTSKLNGLIKEEQKKKDELKKKLEEEAQVLKIQKVQESAALTMTSTQMPTTSIIVATP